MNPTTSARPSRRLAGPILLAGVLAAPLLLAACGDDSDGASEEYQAFCDAELAVEQATFSDNMEGDGSAVESAMTALVEASPNDETRGKVQATIDAFMALQGPPDAAFNETYGELMSVVKDECGFTAVDVTAKEYAFSGIDDEVDAGPAVITIDNVGEEFHEVLVMRRNDGDDTPVMDLLMMDEGDAMAHVQPVGAAFAAPGSKGYTAVDLEPGSYVVACFLPKGATQEAWDQMMSGGPEPDGGPHAMEGMTYEFEVKA